MATETRGLVTVVASEVFDMDVELPVALLPRVDAPADVENYLKDARMGPANGQAMLATICRVQLGEVSEISLMIVGKTKRVMTAKANKVFPEADQEWRLTLEKNYGLFTFPPGTNQSDWLPASKLKLQFYSEFGPRSADRKKLSEAEKIARHMSDFMVRICVIPTEDPKWVSILWVTLPVTDEGPAIP